MDKQNDKKIVVIDDDREFLDELKTLLELSGYEIVAVRDEATALDTIRKTRPVVVLLDLKMPKKTGFQIADEIRHAPEICNIPIIAMSAYYKENYKGLLGSCGINKCLTKPFQPLEIIAEIEKTLKEDDTTMELA